MRQLSTHSRAHRRRLGWLAAAAAAALTVVVAAPATAATAVDVPAGIDDVGLEAAAQIVHQVSGGTATALESASTIQGLRVSPASVDGTPVHTLVSPSDNGVALAAVLTRGQSRADFADPLPAGQHLESAEQGGFDVLSGQDRVGTVAAPWALDASGRALPTHYELRPDGGLTQVVDTTDAAFPVVADPKYSVGFHVVPVWYVEYYWSEMWTAKNLMDKYGGPSAAVVSLLCSKIPSAPAKAVCLYIVKSRYSTIAAQVNYGIAHKRCMKVRSGFGITDAFVFTAWTKTCIK